MKVLGGCTGCDGDGGQRAGWVESGDVSEFISRAREEQVGGCVFD